MRRTTCAVLTGALAVGLAGLSGAGPESAPRVRWAESWEAAKKEAAARNVPIFVSFHKDG
jgi:hypothetical protein